MNFRTSSLTKSFPTQPFTEVKNLVEDIPKIQTQLDPEPILLITWALKPPEQGRDFVILHEILTRYIVEELEFRRFIISCNYVDHSFLSYDNFEI